MGIRHTIRVNKKFYREFKERHNDSITEGWEQGYNTWIDQHGDGIL